ncbi:hypothetical protein [Kineosporia babensis]|uniref:Uncharacterized protein n=1 Tax=Kineosporia babensis TaxID=499548 RepID=A0A9X1SY76_9ACTN|nr:hypothetical protein [Kineosporia babensis]MCD5316977.1 hypothetical protein [Kineosporia babensis]
MSTTKTKARQMLAQANQKDPEYQDIILASAVWDSQVETILDSYIVAPRPQPLLTYRQARRRTSWAYQLHCWGTFFLTAPSLWQVIRTYPAWRRFLVEMVRHDEQRNAFTGVDSWLGRGSELAERQDALRQAQLDAAKAHFAELLRSVNAYEQARIRCAVAVVCHSRREGRTRHADVRFADLFGTAGLGPIRPIAE